MSESIVRLQNRVLADYLDSKHLTNLIPDLNAMAALANYLVTLVTAAQAAADAAGVSLTAMQGLGASTYGIGLDAFDLPRAGDLSSAAFRDWDVLNGEYTQLVTGAYQITAHDHGKLLIVTSGAPTITLPDTTQIADGFRCWYQNLGSGSITIQRAGSTDLINPGNSVGTSSVTIAATSYIGRITRRTGATSFAIG
jgi:predicted lipoprotein with Yx(FWY)xxD motif